MDLETLLSFPWGIMAPEFTIVITATILSLIDLFMAKKADRKPLVWLAIAGIVIALMFLFGQMDQEPTQILADTYRLDGFAKAFKLILLVGAALVLLMAVSYKPKDKIEYRGEFYYLFMTALLGAMFMASSADLITLFVGLELLSISSYILAGIRKNHLGSNEAAMKYVISGGISTAVTLFGMSYIYGLSGSTNLFVISEQLQRIVSGDLNLLMTLAFIIMFVGLSFKIATVPFQMWAPDVYEGSPTPVTAFLSVVSKTAGFVLIIRVFVTTLLPNAMVNGTALFTITAYIGVLAGITMIVGNTIALRQHNIKRMLAYSSIAHAGYLLIPFVGFSEMMFEAIWFYLLAYLLMNLGAFAILQVVTMQTGSEDIKSFAGLYRRSPLVAVAMAVFLLSLAGIPGTAGFIGKITIFLGALMTEPSHYVLAAIMILTTVISYFYYFGVMLQMFFRPANAEGPIKLPMGISVVIIVCLLGTIGFGIAPSIALDFIHSNIDFADFLTVLK